MVLRYKYSFKKRGCFQPIHYSFSKVLLNKYNIEKLFLAFAQCSCHLAYRQTLNHNTKNYTSIRCNH